MGEVARTTVLRRVFNGVAHEVTICAEGFDYAGERFKTLSAIAKHITGTPWLLAAVERDTKADEEPPTDAKPEEPR